MDWILSRKLPAGEKSVFLLVAARIAGEPAWEEEALGLARTAAERPPETAGVRDACLCHGAAGLGHLFNRLYQATGDPGLLAATTSLEPAWDRCLLLSPTAPI